VTDGKATAQNQRIGAEGEELAAAHLTAKGYRIIERNYRCKGGELDIIARDGKTLVFVEVKTRRNAAFGVPQMAVTPFKQRQIMKAALTWLAHHRQQDAAARFDVLAITMRGNASPQIEHIESAFDLAY
jgi:putative endonuclease